MEINNWFSGCLVQAFPWIDGKYIYVNVRCFLPSQSISQAPAWDRSVFVLDDEPGRTIVSIQIAWLTQYRLGKSRTRHA